MWCEQCTIFHFSWRFRIFGQFISRFPDKRSHCTMWFSLVHTHFFIVLYCMGFEPDIECEWMNEQTRIHSICLTGFFARVTVGWAASANRKPLGAIWVHLSHQSTQFIATSSTQCKSQIIYHTPVWSRNKHWSSVDVWLLSLLSSSPSLWCTLEPSRRKQMVNLIQPTNFVSKYVKRNKQNEIETIILPHPCDIKISNTEYR